MELRGGVALLLAAALALAAAGCGHKTPLTLPAETAADSPAGRSAAPAR